MIFNKNIIELAKQNENYRKEIVTGKHCQVVLMSLLPNEEIGEEVHKVDQVLIFVEGTGKAIINGQANPVTENSLIFVPAGTKHNFINTGPGIMKLFTIYAPAQHKPGTIQKLKTDYEAEL